MNTLHHDELLLITRIAAKRSRSDADAIQAAFVYVLEGLRRRTANDAEHRRSLIAALARFGVIEHFRRESVLTRAQRAKGERVAFSPVDLDSLESPTTDPDVRLDCELATRHCRESDLVLLRQVFFDEEGIGALGRAKGKRYGGYFDYYKALDRVRARVNRRRQPLARAA